MVIIAKVNRTTQQRAQVILFSSDLALPWAKLIGYYGLRFQIEFTCRDAKQYWGLDDCMTVTSTGVTNAANLSLFLAQCSPADTVARAGPAVQRAGPQSALSRRQVCARTAKIASGSAGR